MIRETEHLIATQFLTCLLSNWDSTTISSVRSIDMPRDSRSTEDETGGTFIGGHATLSNDRVRCVPMHVM